MPETAPIVILREMTAQDVPNVLDVQQPGAVLGLAEVFPKNRYPFPRDVIGQRWIEEIATPGIDCLAVLRAGAVVGFAAAREDEFLHFGIAVDTGAPESPRMRTTRCWTGCGLGTSNGRG